MIKRNRVFEYFRADEVAECWGGVSDTLYRKLWMVVGHQKDIPNIEDSGPADHIGFECLADHWHRFTEAEQAELNAAAVLNCGEDA